MEPRRVTTRGIIYDQEKLFAIKHKQSDGTESDFWATPGGGLDPMESLHDGLHREMIEETGIAPDIGNLLFIQQFYDGKREQLEFFFHIKNAEDYKVVDLQATTHGHIELTRCDFVTPAREHILPKFLRTIDIANAVSTDQPVFIIDNLNETTE